jgi:hypothetical protein
MAVCGLWPMPPAKQGCSFRRSVVSYRLAGVRPTYEGSGDESRRYVPEAGYASKQW